MSPKNRNIDKVVARFNKLIPDKDIELIILKGHLLIEEILQDILEYFTKNRKYLLEINLTFYQKLYLCRSLVSFFHPHIFDSIKLLNEIRNNLAHNLEPKDFNKKIDKLIGMFEKDMFFVKEVRKEEILKSTI